MVISVENRKILPPRAFCAPAVGVPLGIGYRRTKQTTRMMGLPEGQKSFDRFSHLDTIPACDGQTDTETDRQTDGRTPHDGKHRAMQSVAGVNILRISWTQKRQIICVMR